MAKHLLSLAALEQNDFLHLISRSAALTASADPRSGKLAGCAIGLWFRRTSTRTRTSFVAGTLRLGASPVCYGPADLQTNTGEGLEDTSLMLSQYLDALVIRTAADPRELQVMAAVADIPIINAMTADEHPTQALSDLATLQAHFGTLDGIRMVYCGEGNNTASALAYAVSRVRGMHLDLLTPPGYGLPATVLQRCAELAHTYGGGHVQVHANPSAKIAPAQVVYTTRWQTTGTSKDDALWREKFAPYRVSQQLFEQLRGTGDAVFMHDLPAVRGEDCDGAVLDGSHSIAIKQARQKMLTAMAVLEWCIGR